MTHYCGAYATQVEGGDTSPPARFGAYVAGLERFDAKAFRVPGPEAALMDPQQRALLEIAWEGAAAALPGGGRSK